MLCFKIYMYCCKIIEFSEDQRISRTGSFSKGRRNAIDSRIDFFLAGASTTSDLEYEAELRHSLKKIQAEAEVLAEKHNVTNPDRMVPVIQPRRSLWKNHQGVGFFELLHNNFWVEKVGNGGANLFITSANQKEYVELLRTDKSKTRVRLYADRCDVKLPQSKTFSTFYKGKWVVE